MTEAYHVREGGLLTCCLQRLNAAMLAAVKPPKQGDRLKCDHCEDEYGMVFMDGAWQWACPTLLRAAL